MNESTQAPDGFDDLLAELWKEAAGLWDRWEHSRGFEGYVPADYSMVIRSLRGLQGKADTFLEWGSGLGVVTIMASLMGFRAYGIEVCQELVEHARELAERFAPQAEFAIGSFVPNAYRWDPRLDEDGTRTDFESTDGYGLLDMELSDFDIVYAYPWPHEHQIFRDIMKKHGRKGSLLLTFDVREGMQLKRV